MLRFFGAGVLAALLLASPAMAESRPVDEYQALIKRIRGCLYAPDGAAEAGVTATLDFTIGKNGRVSDSDLRLVSHPESRLEVDLAAAAMKAVVRCSPYKAFAGEEVRATFAPE